jgi:hypothetical protein
MSFDTARSLPLCYIKHKSTGLSTEVSVEWKISLKAVIFLGNFFFRGLLSSS